jgi:hypothetical protein
MVDTPWDEQQINHRKSDGANEKFAAAPRQAPPHTERSQRRKQRQDRNGKELDHRFNSA